MNPVRIIGYVQDKQQKSLIEQNQSNYDQLTGIPNRNLFYDHLNLAIANAKRFDVQTAILLLDIDNFKRINDSLGHEFGDQLIKQVAERFRPCLKETDTMARMGGDEFVFIISDISNVHSAVTIAHEIFKALKIPFRVNNREIYITASIGISFYPTDGEDMEDLVKNADTAMYRAKQLGKNTYQLYAKEMNAKAFEQLALENNLRNAISKNELTVYYQPRINIVTGKIIGVEALVRWIHPELGLVPPGMFIPIAEETDLIIPIGEKVLYDSCAQHHSWMEQGFPPFQMAVNLSIRQFRQRNLVDIVKKVLQETHMNPNYLELEITESMAMENMELTIATLSELKRMGIRIAMDDFGTGYSSLSYLKQYPLDILKIDQSFIRAIIYDKDIVTIVKAILELARGLNLDVIVEGVENYEQLELLRSLNCIEMQGYIFARPMPEKDVSSILQTGQLLLTGMIY